MEEGDVSIKYIEVVGSHSHIVINHFVNKLVFRGITIEIMQSTMIPSHTLIEFVEQRQADKQHK